MPKHIFGLFILIVGLIGCNEKSFFSETYQTQGFWHKDSVAEFKFEVKDTISKYNCFLHIRNTTDYKYSNLFLITSMQFPYGKVVEDTLEYEMAFKNGKLMGEGLGNLKYNKLWYKEGVKFSEPGTYKIKIRHAMREAGETDPLTKLKGVEEIGFSYESIRAEKS